MLAQSETQVGRLEIERLKLMLAKLRREQFGQSSERGKQLIEQLELAIEDLEESQAVEEAKVEAIAPEAAKLLVAGFAVFGEGRTTRGARLRRKSMSMM